MKALAGSGTLTGIFLAVVGFAFAAFADVCYKYISGSYPVLVMGFYGTFATLLLAVAATLARGEDLRRCFVTKKRGLHLLRGCVTTLNFFLFIYGISGLPVAQTYTIDNMSPMVATLLAFFFLGERPEIHRVLCIVGGFVGVLVVLRPGIIPLDIHALSVLCSTVTYATSNIMTRRIGKQDLPLTFMFHALSVALVVEFFYTLHLGWITPAPRDLLIILAASVFAFVSGLAITRAFTIADVAVVSKFQYTQLLWGVILGYALFHDLPDIWVVVGGALIIGSGIYLAYCEKAKKA